VVLGVDFSASSRRALEIATAVSARASAPLELLHVWNPNHLAGSGATLAALRSWIADQKGLLIEQLDDWAADARRGGVDVSSRVVEGVASQVIPEVARSSGAGLVIVGRQGSANLAHVLLGSVSERVVHLASCPVLVVPEHTAAPRSPERLMVGVDFSDASRDAYRAALRIAEELGASRGLVLVHAHLGESDNWLADWSEFADRGEPPHDRAALERWAEAPEKSRVPIESRVLAGNPEQILMSAAESEACDWLVLGLQGRTGLTALLMGSTTDRVLKLAERPVLVVPMTSPRSRQSTN
jgi:nucleotide-binding universal stress UspA family protein